MAGMFPGKHPKGNALQDDPGPGYAVSMLAHAISTLFQAARAPWVWASAALGLALTWFGLRFAVLALHEDPARDLELVAGSSYAAGTAAALWLLARALADDEHSGFCLASDAAGPGETGRRVGRWLGATACGGLVVLLVGVVGSGLAGLDAQGSLLLYSASIVGIGLVCAWASALATTLGAMPAVLLALGLWVVGHLPWGHAALLPGLPGRVLRAFLPGPAHLGGGTSAWRAAPPAACMTLALLLLLHWMTRGRRASSRSV